MTYRDELSAVRAREASLESDLADVRERRAALEARRALPLLDAVSVAAPCSARALRAAPEPTGGDRGWLLGRLPAVKGRGVR